MVANTVRNTASCLAALFWDNLDQSLLHVKDGTSLRPLIKRLLWAFDNVDLPPNCWKAVTPKFLSALYQATHFHSPNSTTAITADLIIAAWFFAMRVCKFAFQKHAGRTKPIRLSNITFCDHKRNLIPHDSLKIFASQFVTIMFRDQKNGRKWEARTQQRTSHHELCPILRWASIVFRLVLHGYKPDTQVFILPFHSNKLPVVFSVSMKHFLRFGCQLLGGLKVFGFGPKDIRSKSIQSGAAMVLFMADVSVAKIMILGRWSSDTFLVYIRPRVLEWTLNMS